MTSDDDELFTLNECLAMIMRVWTAIDNSVLEHVAADAIAQGFDEDDVRQVIETLAHALAVGRSRRRQTAAAMLESKSGALNLQ